MFSAQLRGYLCSILHVRAKIWLLEIPHDSSKKLYGMILTVIADESPSSQEDHEDDKPQNVCARAVVGRPSEVRIVP